jgi:cbb3-type cytochrome oxidase subunit 3
MAALAACFGLTVVFFYRREKKARNMPGEQEGSR